METQDDGFPPVTKDTLWRCEECNELTRSELQTFQVRETYHLANGSFLKAIRIMDICSGCAGDDQERPAPRRKAIGYSPDRLSRPTHAVSEEVERPDPDLGGEGGGSESEEEPAEEGQDE